MPVNSKKQSQGQAHNENTRDNERQMGNSKRGNNMTPNKKDSSAMSGNRGNNNQRNNSR